MGWLTFGEALREARYKKGWSQTELAKESGIARGAISQIEMGRINGKVATMKQLAITLGCAFMISGDGWLVLWKGKSRG